MASLTLLKPNIPLKLRVSGFLDAVREVIGLRRGQTVGLEFKGERGAGGVRVMWAELSLCLMSSNPSQFSSFECVGHDNVPILIIFIFSLSWLACVA